MDFPDRYDRQKIQTVCLMVIAVVLVTFSIYWLRPVLVPLVVALFVVSGVTPLLNALELRLGVNRLVAAAITIVAGLLAMIIFGFAIWVSMVDLSRNAKAYRTRVQEIVNHLEESASVVLPKSLVPSHAKSLPQTAADDASDFIDIFVRDGITLLSQALIGLISTSAIVLIYVFFLLIGTPTIGDSGSMAREIDQQVRSYLSLKTVISIFTGAAFGATLYLFGVPMAFTFGVLAFLLNFVPNIGPIVASLLPIPLILLDPNASILWMVSVIAVTGLIQLLSGNLVEPKLMGNSSDLHPVTILVALMFWGMMWGVVGMFLATPITAAMRIMLQRIEVTKPIAELMAGRWQISASEAATSAY
ncbi:AI-2E family transporter [Aporhodopirellula aestuarii]|uniref:AI-2E family transporter n=1 Tax=Aporhodopirellula aestuarii TaxID=2950107 RepID=A0ABT0TYL2_9BACT|nr:AI-2E family transporter [Aporhodopirellula aestuarii]MCM2369689.1 AI-2E family transporter [Aporhodopirellula aestuarii]